MGHVNHVRIQHRGVVDRVRNLTKRRYSFVQITLRVLGPKQQRYVLPVAMISLSMAFYIRALRGLIPIRVLSIFTDT